MGQAAAQEEAALKARVIEVAVLIMASMATKVTREVIIKVIGVVANSNLARGSAAAAIWIPE